MLVRSYWISTSADFILNEVSCSNCKVSCKFPEPDACLVWYAGPRLVPPHLWSVCDALVGALPGRVWEGKVFLLKAVKTVFTACKEEVERRGTDTPVSVTMASVVYVCGPTAAQKLHILRMILFESLTVMERQFQHVCFTCDLQSVHVMIMRQVCDTIMWWSCDPRVTWYAQVLEALFKECGKKNVLYKTTAMDSLGGILEVYNIDMFSNVFKLVQETINPVSVFP